MSCRYLIRIFRSEIEDDSIRPGTVVTPTDRTLCVYGSSADEVERILLQDVQKGKLPAGRVYQICPQIGRPELIRSVAITTDMNLERVFLDPVAGLYSALRRIRSANPQPAPMAQTTGQPTTR
jgi:hypothetical protein